MSSLSQFFGSGPIATTFYTSGSGTHTFNPATKSVKYVITGRGGKGADTAAGTDTGGASGGAAGGTIVNTVNLAPGVTSWDYVIPTLLTATILNGWAAPAGDGGGTILSTTAGSTISARSLFFNTTNGAGAADTIWANWFPGGCGGAGGNFTPGSTGLPGARGSFVPIAANTSAQAFAVGALGGLQAGGVLGGGGGGGGGTSYWGVGGAGGNGGGASPQNGSAAPVGSYGAGGGGAGGGNSSSSGRTGGAGGSGVVLIIEFPYYQ